MLEVLGGSGGGGAGLGGYLAPAAVLPIGSGGGNATCPPFYEPTYFMSWFPQGMDTVAWTTTLLSQVFPYFSIATGPNTMTLGLVTGLGAFDAAVKDGFDTASPASALALAQPQGVLQHLCLSHGIYKLSVLQAALPHRPGQFIVRRRPALCGPRVPACAAKRKRATRPLRRWRTRTAAR